MRRISVCFLTLGILAALKIGVGVLADPIKDKTPQQEATHETQSANLATNDQLKNAQEDERDEGKRPEEMMNVEYSVADLVVPFASRAPGKGTAKPVLTADFDRLIELLHVVQPESWDNAGGKASITILPATLGLVIRQTQSAHEEIADLFGQVRRVADFTLSLKMSLFETPEDQTHRYGHIGSSRYDLALSGNAADEAGLVAKDAVAKGLLNHLKGRRSTRVLTVPRLSLCNGQTSDLVYETRARDAHGVSGYGFKIFAYISADRKIRLKFAAPVNDVNQVLESTISVSVRDQETIVCDVTRLLEIYRRAERAAAATTEASADDEVIKYVTPESHGFRQFLVVTPRFLVAEEEEELLGVDLPKRDAQ